MKHIIRKAFINYEKEESWLNEMAAKGLALSDYSWCRYVFEESPHVQYTYRMELLEYKVDHPESQNYLQFLEDSGVECVATYFRWVYLRKKTSEGAFDLYSDIASKVKHYIRIWQLWNTMKWVELLIGSLNILIGAFNMVVFGISGNTSITNITLGFFLVGLGGFFHTLEKPLRRKIQKLRKEQVIRES